MVGLEPLRTTIDFNMHEMTPLYQRVWGIRIGVEVQFRSTSLVKHREYQLAQHPPQQLHRFPQRCHIFLP